MKKIYDAPVAEKAAVQASEPVRSKAAAKRATDSVSQAQVNDYDYSVTVTEGSVISIEGSERLDVKGSGSVEISLAEGKTESGKSIVFGDDTDNKYNIIATLKGVVVNAQQVLAGIWVNRNL